MTRWLGIDYGEKRIGIAITDPLRMFVNPFVTIENRSDVYVIGELKRIFTEQGVERVIVGLPLNKEGEDTIKTGEVRAFFAKLESEINLPLFLYNELYSTCDANDFLKQKGLNWKESRKIVDQIAAAVILKSYLEGCGI